jgi:hypothetical protein
MPKWHDGHGAQWLGLNDEDRFGDPEKPLLLSVLAPPDAPVTGALPPTDSYRRFIQMYADVVLGVLTTRSSRTSSRTRRRASVYELDTDVTADEWAR